MRKKLKIRGLDANKPSTDAEKSKRITIRP